MSSIEAKTSADSITTGGQGPYYSVLGFGSIGIAVAGTFTSGTFKFQGSNDGNTWTDLQILQASVPLTNDEITAIGNYVCGIVSYQTVRLLATSFVGQIIVTSSISPQIVLPVVEGGDIVVDSLTLSGIENAALATNADGLVYGVTGVSGDVMRLSGTGTGELDSVVWTGVRYVAVGAAGAIYTSLTGTSGWVQRTSGTGAQWFSVAYNGSNLLVASGLNGNIITSPDGITWTARTSGLATNLSSVTWDGTVFIAVGSSQGVTTSPDGITWTVRTFGTTVAIRGVASTSALAIAVCAGGTIKTSTDHGVTWTLRTSGVATTLWKVAVNAGGTLWTAVGDSGVILTSPDGTTWTARTSGVVSTLENIAFGNSKWVAIGDGGVIRTSPDAITWSGATSGTTGNLFGLVYGDKWVVVGTAVKLTSSDAITWTAVSQFVWIASTPTGTGALVSAAGASAFTGERTFSDSTAIGGTVDHTIEPEGGSVLQLIKTAASALIDNCNLQMIGYATSSVMHFITGEGTQAAPAVATSGSTHSIGFRFLTLVSGTIKAWGSSAAIIVTKTDSTSTVAVPAADMAFQTGDGSGTRPTRLYVAPNGFIGIGARSSASLPVAQLDVRASTAGTAVVYASTTRTSLSNTALYGEATGTGAAENIGLYLEAKNGTLNKGIQIHFPVAGAGNYAIYSDATAQSFFGGSLDATAFKVGGVAGASGSFLSADAKTVTVVNGIITAIV